MVYSIIQKSQLEGAHRLDAEYYQPEYLEIEGTLKSVKSWFLKDISVSIKKGIFDLSPNNYREEGVPLIRTTDIKDPLIDFSTAVFISDEVHTRHSTTTLYPSDLVFTKIGASIGDVAMLPEIFSKYNFSQNVAGVRLAEDRVKSEYLLAFLLSKFGRKQILRSQMISGQGKLELVDIRNLRVAILPDNFQNDVSRFVSQAQLLKEESLKYYSQAEKLLLEELGLADFKSKEDLSFIVNISEVQEVNRSDPDFFQPKYSNLIKRIGKVTKLLSIVIKRKTDSIRVDPEKEYNYIEISDINVGTGGLNYNKVIGQELPANAKLKISGGELLVSKVRPTRGAVAILPEEWQEDFIASGAFSVFETNSPNREYLQVVLRSIIGRLQLEKPTTGTSYPTVTDEDIENVLVPIVSSSLKTKIADLVKKSHEARSKAKQLIEEAKRRVENLIEMR